MSRKKIVTKKLLFIINRANFEFLISTRLNKIWYL